MSDSTFQVDADFSEAYVVLGLQSLVAQGARVERARRLSNSVTRFTLEGTVGEQAVLALPRYYDFAGNAGERRGVGRGRGPRNSPQGGGGPGWALCSLPCICASCCMQ